MRKNAVFMWFLGVVAILLVFSHESPTAAKMVANGGTRNHGVSGPQATGTTGPVGSNLGTNPGLTFGPRQNYRPNQNPGTNNPANNFRPNTRGNFRPATVNSGQFKPNVGAAGVNQNTGGQFPRNGGTGNSNPSYVGQKPQTQQYVAPQQVSTTVGRTALDSILNQNKTKGSINSNQQGSQIGGEKNHLNQHQVNHTNVHDNIHPKTTTNCTTGNGGKDCGGGKDNGGKGTGNTSTNNNTNTGTNTNTNGNTNNNTNTSNSNSSANSTSGSNSTASVGNSGNSSNTNTNTANGGNSTSTATGGNATGGNSTSTSTSTGGNSTATGGNSTATGGNASQSNSGNSTVNTSVTATGGKGGNSDVNISFNPVNVNKNGDSSALAAALLQQGRQQSPSISVSPVISGGGFPGCGFNGGSNWPCDYGNNGGYPGNGYCNNNGGYYPEPMGVYGCYTSVPLAYYESTPYVYRDQQVAAETPAPKTPEIVVRKCGCDALVCGDKGKVYYPWSSGSCDIVIQCKVIEKFQKNLHFPVLLELVDRNRNPYCEDQRISAYMSKDGPIIYIPDCGVQFKINRKQWREGKARYLNSGKNANTEPPVLQLKMN